MIGRVWFVEPGESMPSWHFCRVQTWTSNCLITSPEPILLSDPITGILAASYGGYMTAVLDTWRRTNNEEWTLLSPLPFPDVITDGDTNSWTTDALPDLGGNAFYYPGDSILTGVRIAPPPKDPHTFHRDRKAEKDQKVTIDPKTEEIRSKSKRREGRAKSCTRYSEFRTKNNEPAETRGQHRSSDRGRRRSPRSSRKHRSPVYLR